MSIKLFSGNEARVSVSRIAIIAFVFCLVLGGALYLLMRGNNLELTSSDGLKKDVSSGISDILVGGGRTVTYNGVSVRVFIDEPKDGAQDETDVLLAFQGTQLNDERGVLGAEKFIKRIRNALTKENNKRLAIVSVAYPQEGILLGDEMREAEAALLWTQKESPVFFQKKVRNVYLFGHSRGGYVVTRLNTMHKTGGVIANGSGPIDLSFRCGLEESGKLLVSKSADDGGLGQVCDALNKRYGSVKENPDAYKDRSLNHFTENLLAPELFVQGMQDSKIQMALWPEYKEKLALCHDCAPYDIVEVPSAGHPAVFDSPEGARALNHFLER